RHRSHARRPRGGPGRGLLKAGEPLTETHPLVERQAQVRVVDDAIRRAGEEGIGQGFVLDAPAGAGKSSLLDAVRDGAQGCVVLSALADEYEQDYGWGVVLQLFERHLASLSGTERRHALGGPAARAATILAGGPETESVEA